MEFFRIHRDIPFMRHALTFNVISLVTFVLAVIFLATRGLNLGVDFKGGVAIQEQFQTAPQIDEVRSTVSRLGSTPRWERDVSTRLG